LLDNSSKTLLADQSTTFRDIVLQLLSKLEVSDGEFRADYFGIFTSLDGDSITNVNNKDDFVTPALLNLPASARLVFMIRLFMPSIRGIQTKAQVAAKIKKDEDAVPDKYYFESASIKDENMLMLQFTQAVYYVITGTFPTDYDTALILGAYYFLQKFGRVDHTLLKPGFIGNKIVEFVPLKHVKGKAVEMLEADLIQKIESYNSMETENCGIPRAYLNKVWMMENFRETTFYRGMIHDSDILPAKAIVGVSHKAVKIFDKDKKLIKSFRIELVLRWGYHPGKSFFFDANVENVDKPLHINVDLKNGQQIADLLADYALAFLKESEREGTDKNDSDDDADALPEFSPQEKIAGRRISQASATAFGSLFNNGVVIEEGVEEVEEEEVGQEEEVVVAVEPSQSEATAKGEPEEEASGADTSDEIVAATKEATAKGEPEEEASGADASDEIVAATKVQSIFRGVSAREKVGIMVQEMIDNGEIDIGED